jgi:CelD/BcsL family acetyltransferase involved in cellulose biosynthesis
MAEALDLAFRAFVVESGGECLGVVPMLFRRRGPLSSVNVLPIGYVGPLVRGDALRAGRLAELVTAVEPVLRRQLTVVTRWGFSPGLGVSAEELRPCGFEVVNSDNYIIPGTRSLDDCLKAMARKRRQSIRHNEVLGLYATDSSREEITGWLPQQVVDVYRRQGSPSLYPLPALKRLADRLASDPRMLWRTVKQADGNVVGMTASIISDDRLWFWLLGGTPSPGVSPQTLCYWDMIQSCVSTGLTLDSGGAPTEEIKRFKASIGAELETFATAVRVRPKGAYKLGQALYSRTLGRRA